MNKQIYNNVFYILATSSVSDQRLYSCSPVRGAALSPRALITHQRSRKVVLRF